MRHPLFHFSFAITHQELKAEVAEEGTVPGDMSHMAPPVCPEDSAVANQPDQGQQGLEASDDADFCNRTIRADSCQ